MHLCVSSMGDKRLQNFFDHAALKEVLVLHQPVVALAVFFGADGDRFLAPPARLFQHVWVHQSGSGSRGWFRCTDLFLRRSSRDTTSTDFSLEWLGGNRNRRSRRVTFPSFLRVVRTRGPERLHFDPNQIQLPSNVTAPTPRKERKERKALEQQIFFFLACVTVFQYSRQEC